MVGLDVIFLFLFLFSAFSKCDSVPRKGKSVIFPRQSDLGPDPSPVESLTLGIMINAKHRAPQAGGP